MRTLGKVVVFFLAAVGFLTAGFVTVVWLLARAAFHGGLAATAMAPQQPAATQGVLTLDLSHAYTSREGVRKAFGLGPSALTLQEVITTLGKAAKDPNIKGLVALVEPSDIGFADVQDLRTAIANFRASGKPTVAFSPDLGVQASREYYLASAFGDIWLQPSGTVGLTGFAAEVPFLAKALDDIGIGVTVGARYEYKDAVDPLIRTQMSDAQRASTRRLLQSWLVQVQQGVSADRHLSLAAVQTITQGPPLFADEARKAGLVDHLGYRDQMEDALKAATGSDKRVTIQQYAAANPDKPNASATHFAYVAATGTIQNGRSTPSAMGAETIAKAVADAIADPTVKALVLRIDSPGGDYVAADTIWREVQRARDKHLPVVVSMGDVAASGGYFMALPANKIVAEPGTITGSVGVFSLKPQLSKLWDKLDVHWDTVELGDYALMWSGNRPFTPAQSKFFEHMLDVIYQDFTGKLAKGRNFDARHVDDVARGRVWSGADAKAVGLVDDLGGFEVALADAKKEAGLAPDAAITLVSFPKPKPPVEEFLEMLQDGDLPMLMSRLDAVYKLSSSVLSTAQQSGLTHEGSALQAPPLGLREQDQ